MTTVSPVFAVPVVLATVVGLFAADRSFTPWTTAKPVLDRLHENLPPGLKNPDESKWLSWARREDKSIRSRLDQGDLDSMVNLLLYGTSFTSQPRVSMEGLTEAEKSGVLRSRVDDLVAGLHMPGNNERLLILQHLLQKRGFDPADADAAQDTGKFVYKNLLRVIQERKTIAERAAAADRAQASSDPAALLDRSSLFENRGVSLDTGIFPDFTVEQTLRDLKQRGVLREGQVVRVGVIGPGLDFIDKNEASAWDYYPQQTIQPFALYDSLVRLDLAKSGGLSVSIFDISSRVIDHIRRARERAEKNAGYVIQLPRDISRPWPRDLLAYWNTLGDQAGTAVRPIEPPQIFQGLQTRAVEFRPQVVLACDPVDLNIILERLNLPAGERFDVIVATNIFVYYDPFEQALALENASAMLKPGGLLLTNDRLPTISGGSMRLAGVTVVPFDVPGVNAREAVGWYQKQ